MQKLQSIRVSQHRQRVNEKKLKKISYMVRAFYLRDRKDFENFQLQHPLYYTGRGISLFFWDSKVCREVQYRLIGSHVSVAMNSNVKSRVVTDVTLPWSLPSKSHRAIIPPGIYSPHKPRAHLTCVRYIHIHKSRRQLF